MLSVEKVRYPGLESHPQHELGKKQTTGFGGVITFWLKGLSYIMENSLDRWPC